MASQDKYFISSKLKEATLNRLTAMVLTVYGRSQEAKQFFDTSERNMATPGPVIDR